MGKQSAEDVDIGQANLWDIIFNSYFPSTPNRYTRSNVFHRRWFYSDNKNYCLHTTWRPI